VFWIWTLTCFLRSGSLPVRNFRHTTELKRKILGSAVASLRQCYFKHSVQLAADSHLLELQRLQNRVLRTFSYSPRRTPTRALHRMFQIPYIYIYVKKMCRKQAEVIQTHDNVNVRKTGENEAQHRKYKRLKLDGRQV